MPLNINCRSVGKFLGLSLGCDICLCRVAAFHLGAMREGKNGLNPLSFGTSREEHWCVEFQAGPVEHLFQTVFPGG